MNPVSIFELANYSFFEIFEQMKKNCESARPAALDEIKYADLINFAACCELIAGLLCEWDTSLYSRLEKHMLFKISSFYIDFEEVYNRLRHSSARDKETYWSCVSDAIRNNKGPTKVVLRYAPESFHSDHMEAFHTVMSSLKNKLNLKTLDIYAPGYTLESLERLNSLETLRLNIRMDIDDLIESCRLNKNLRVLEYMNNETGGKRLAAIAPHCEQLEELAFKMRPDCDASEYRPLAKIPRLKYLQIAGVHQKGTLQPLLEGLAGNQLKVLNMLTIDDAAVAHDEALALAQIKTLTNVKCGFDDTQSIGQLSQLTKLNCLEILSKHDFGAIADQVLSILMESKVETKIELVYLSLTYRPIGELWLHMKEENANASDYVALSTLPGLFSLAINGLPQSGSLRPILSGLALAFTLTKLLLPNITTEETAAVSEIASLRILKCGFAETHNAELLAQLLVLEELNISSVPSTTGSLQHLLAALAAKETQTLQNFSLLQGNIDSGEATELARLSSLETLECQLADPLDIQFLSQLTELKSLSLRANEMLGQISPGVLKVINSCKKLAIIFIVMQHETWSYPSPVDTSSSVVVEMLQACRGTIRISSYAGTILLNREKKELRVTMDFFKQNKLPIEPLARIEYVNHMKIYGYHVAGSLREFFATLAMRTKHDLQDLYMHDSSLDFMETMELAKITSWTKFRGHLSDGRSFQHLLHLSDFNVSFGDFLDWNIIFDKSTEELTVVKGGSLKPLSENWLMDNFDLTPLASLQNLRHVTIRRVFKVGSMHKFIGQLAMWQGENLQLLRVDKRYKMSYAELSEVSRIKSLRTLVCGLSGVTDTEIEQLAELPQLAVLIVGSHQSGSLTNLLGNLAARECPKLEHLVVRGGHLIPQEVAKVSAISSLKRLECAFCSTEGFDVLSQRSCIEDLVIKTRKGESILLDLLTAYASPDESKILNLVIKGPAVDQEPASVFNLVSRIPRLKSLKFHIEDTEGIEGLAESLHLEELTISFGTGKGSLAGLFRALSLKDSLKLKNLVIWDISIDLEEARHLVQIDSITSLKCGFHDEKSFSLLANMTNLESLNVTSRHEFENISGYLLDIFRECRKLKTIDFGYTVYYLCHDFLKNALDILKSVRDPATQAPLEIRSSILLYELGDEESLRNTYLIVTKGTEQYEDESKDESESDDESESESENEDVSEVANASSYSLVTNYLK